MTNKLPENTDHLVWASTMIRKELFETGTIVLSTHYTPTDWAGTSPAEQRAFWGGFREAMGACPVCHIWRAANGACDC